jgi:sRNA-binding regulator protein Hfq
VTADLEYCIRDESTGSVRGSKTNMKYLNKREISNIGYTTLYDAIYLANGMKVRNLIYGYSNKFGIYLNHIKSPCVGT